MRKSLQVAEHEPAIAHGRRPYLIRYRPAEDWTIRHESVKLPALATGICFWRQLRQQVLVENTARERWLQLHCIYANDPRNEPLAYEPPGQQRRVFSPDREQRVEAASFEQSFPICPHVIEKEIPECNNGGGRKVARALDQRFEERTLVRFISAVRVQTDFMQRETDRARLLGEERAPDSVHADAIVIPRYGCKKPDDLNVGALLERVQGKRAVLAAAPAQDYGGRQARPGAPGCCGSADGGGQRIPISILPPSRILLPGASKLKTS